VALILGLANTFAESRGIARSEIPDLNGMLISLPAFLLWIPIGLMLSNCVLFAVPPLRRVAERFVADAERPGFGESQRQLLVAAGAIGVVCIPLIVLGFRL
jgi:hypothetical protein